MTEIEKEIARQIGSEIAIVIDTIVIESGTERGKKKESETGREKETGSEDLPEIESEKGIATMSEAAVGDIDPEAVARVAHKQKNANKKGEPEILLHLQCHREAPLATQGLLRVAAVACLKFLDALQSERTVAVSASIHLQEMTKSLS